MFARHSSLHSPRRSPFWVALLLVQFVFAVAFAGAFHSSYCSDDVPVTSTHSLHAHSSPGEHHDTTSSSTSQCLACAFLGVAISTGAVVVATLVVSAIERAVQFATFRFVRAQRVTHALVARGPPSSSPLVPIFVVA